MKVIDYDKIQIKNMVVALGKFEGLHKGHMLLIDRVIRLSKENGYPGGVFNINFPREKEINLPFEKNLILENLQIDYIINCEFSESFAKMSALEFIKDILVDRLGVSYVVVGADFRFGCNRQGDVALLEKYSHVYDFRVVAVEKLSINNVIVSSTYIRNLISIGHMRDIYDYMGRFYSITGTVVKGRQLGRTIGFPTANIIPADNKILPPFGAYRTVSSIDDKEYLSITNVGNNPTIDGASPVTIETHVIGYSQDLYGKTIKISFTDFIRKEARFDSIEELKAQLNKDKMFVLHQ